MKIVRFFRRIWRRMLIKRRLHEARRQERLTHQQYISLVSSVREAKIVWDQWISVELHRLYKVRDQFERKALELKRMLSCC